MGRAAAGGSLSSYTFAPPPAAGQVGAIQCLASDDPRARAFRFGGLGDPVYAVEMDEEIVSACVSSRQNEEAAAFWVYAAPEHRGKGYGQSVVAARARGTMAAGRLPFYSHQIDDPASAGLARSLGLIPLVEEIVVSRAGLAEDDPVTGATGA